MMTSSIIHATTFILTLVSLALILCFATWSVMVVVLSSSSSSSGEGTAQDIRTAEEIDRISMILGIVGAALCWALAGYLVYKRWKKQRQRRERQLEQNLFESVEGEITPSTEYGSIPVAEPAEAQGDDNDEDDDGTASPKPLLVFSLTFLGFLDELAYFPSLILGRIFSIPDLCLGTLLAGLVMLAIVTIALAPFQPFIDWLDRRIKLYMVVTLFAIVLTVRVVVEEL
jgi:hypothetical protein